MKTLRIVPVAMLVVLWALAAAQASPQFSISSLDEWNDALGGGGGGGGSIAPVEGFHFENMVNADPSLWPDAYDGAHFLTPELYAADHEDGSANSEPALIMYWGDPTPGDGTDEMIPDDYYAAAWEYQYSLDPDLSQYGPLEFSIHAPEVCWYVSVNLIDADGDYKEWIWHVGGPAPGEIPPCTWTTVTVNPATGASNYPVSVPVFETMLPPTDPLYTPLADGAVDLTRIVAIRFDENGRWTDFPLPPGVPSTGNFVWNAWDHVEFVVPEPAGLGLLGIALLAVRKRRRT